MADLLSGRDNLVAGQGHSNGVVRAELRHHFLFLVGQRVLFVLQFLLTLAPLISGDFSVCRAPICQTEFPLQPLNLILQRGALMVDAVEFPDAVDILHDFAQNGGGVFVESRAAHDSVALFQSDVVVQGDRMRDVEFGPYHPADVPAQSGGLPRAKQGDQRVVFDVIVSDFGVAALALAAFHAANGEEQPINVFDFSFREALHGLQSGRAAQHSANRGRGNERFAADSRQFLHALVRPNFNLAVYGAVGKGLHGRDEAAQFQINIVLAHGVFLSLVE